MSGQLIGPIGVLPASGGGGITGWAGLIPQTGLVAAWPFDTTYTTTSVATDPVGGKNATLTAVTLNGSGPSTNLNNAGVFTAGSSSRGDTALVNLPSPNFTLTLWAYISNNLAGPQLIANDQPFATNNGFEAWATTGSSAEISTGNGATTQRTNAAYTAVTWTMLSWTYDGTTITPYSNGVAGTPTTQTGPLGSAANTICFGVNPHYNGDFLTGMLAGIAIYNRVLSGAEIAAIAAL